MADLWLFPVTYVISSLLLVSVHVWKLVRLWERVKDERLLGQVNASFISTAFVTNPMIVRSPPGANIYL